MKSLFLLGIVFVFAAAGCAHPACVKAEAVCRGGCKKQKVNSAHSSEDNADPSDHNELCLERCDKNLEQCNLKEDEAAQAREGRTPLGAPDNDRKASNGADEANGGVKTDEISPPLFDD